MPNTNWAHIVRVNFKVSEFGLLFFNKVHLSKVYVGIEFTYGWPFLLFHFNSITFSFPIIVKKKKTSTKLNNIRFFLFIIIKAFRHKEIKRRVCELRTLILSILTFKRLCFWSCRWVIKQELIPKYDWIWFSVLY